MKDVREGGDKGIMEVGKDRKLEMRSAGDKKIRKEGERENLSK